MPTNRRPRKRGRSAQELTASDLYFLQVGWVSPDMDDAQVVPTLLGICRPQSYAATVPPAWKRVAERVLKQWLAQRPGTRPWAWWFVEAPEPRLVLDLPPEYRERADDPRWRESFGMTVGYRADLAIQVESQPAYLDRLGLLTEKERRALEPKAWAPELLIGGAEDAIDIPDLHHLMGQRSHVAAMGSKTDHGGASNGADSTAS